MSSSMSMRSAIRWAHVAVVLDLLSRKVVGWSVSDACDEALALEALDNALNARRPARGVVHHSDRGSTYTAKKHRKRLKRAGIQCSMSREGNCWDNACAERFFCSFRNEWLHNHSYTNIEAVYQSTFKYIEIYYNRKRLHQALGYLTPAEFDIHHPWHTAECWSTWSRSPTGCEHDMKHHERISHQIMGSVKLIPALRQSGCPNDALRRERDRESEKETQSRLRRLQPCRSFVGRCLPGLRGTHPSPRYRRMP